MAYRQKVALTHDDVITTSNGGLSNSLLSTNFYFREE